MLTLVDQSTGTQITEGVTLDVTELGHEGSTVLVLHGVEGVGPNRPMLETLASRHRVLAPSHPGFDLSPQPWWLDSVEDLAYLYLDYLAKLDAREVTVIGLQFGGWVAAELAVRSCERLARLILVDPVGIKLGGPQDRDIADVFAMSRAEVDARIFHDPSKGPGDLTTAPEQDVLRIARNEEAVARYGWEPYLHNPRLRRWLHRICVPSLLVWGVGDGIVSRDYGKAFAEAIPGSSFAEIDAAGHRPQVEQPAELCRLIEEFSG